MLNILILLTLLNDPMGGTKPITQYPQNEVKTKSLYCSQIYKKIPVGRFGWRTKCLSIINVPSYKNKGCPYMTSFLEGHSGCFLFQIKAFKNKEYSLVEVLQKGVEVFEKRTDYV